MYLMYHDDEEGNRVYTLQVRRVVATCLDVPCGICGVHIVCHCSLCTLPVVLQKAAPDGAPTQSAHPARFSPDDKFSRERIICKKRFGLLPTQQKALEL